MPSKIFNKPAKKRKKTSRLAFLRRIRIPNLLHREPDESTQIKVPKEWINKSKPLQTQNLIVVEEGKVKRKKRKISWLRNTKRLIAGILIPINFVIGQATLMGPTNTQGLWLLFMANTFIGADYLWKTRSVPEPFEEPKQ